MPEQPQNTPEPQGAPHPAEHAEPAELAEPAKPTWLFAAWPGMGNVAILAATSLIDQLGMVQAGELASREHFDIAEVDADKGVIAPAHLPRGLFFRAPKPVGGRELVVFVGEAQPSQGVYDYAHKLLAAAETMGVRPDVRSQAGGSRVVTFASMASALHPASSPKVFGLATDRATLADLEPVEVQPLRDGQITGLNGVVLAAAAARGLSGLCLLAEIPFFAANVANPKAARAALSVLGVLTGLDISLAKLDEQAQAVDAMLVQVLEKLQAQNQLPDDFGHAQDNDPGGGQDDADESQDGPSHADDAPTDAGGLSYDDRQRIEALFEKARKDRAHAVELKALLDRLGVFERYEDRFLDLFRRAD